MGSSGYREAGVHAVRWWWWSRSCCCRCSCILLFLFLSFLFLFFLLLFFLLCFIVRSISDISLITFKVIFTHIRLAKLCNVLLFRKTCGQSDKASGQQTEYPEAQHRALLPP